MNPTKKMKEAIDKCSRQYSQGLEDGAREGFTAGLRAGFNQALDVAETYDDEQFSAQTVIRALLNEMDHLHIALEE